MKKITYLLLVCVILSVFISGCGAKEPDPFHDGTAMSMFLVLSIDDMVEASDAVLLVEYEGASGETIQGDQNLPETHTKIQMGSYYAENNYRVIDVIAGSWTYDKEVFTGLQYIGVYDYIEKTFEETNSVQIGDYMLVCLKYDDDYEMIYLNPFEGAKHLVNKSNGRIHYSKKLEGYRKYRTVEKLKKAYADK